MHSFHFFRNFIDFAFEPALCLFLPIRSRFVTKKKIFSKCISSRYNLLKNPIFTSKWWHYMTEEIWNIWVLIQRIHLSQKCVLTPNCGKPSGFQDYLLPQIFFCIFSVFFLSRIIITSPQTHSVPLIACQFSILLFESLRISLRMNDLKKKSFRHLHFKFLRKQKGMHYTKNVSKIKTWVWMYRCAGTFENTFIA